MDIPYIKGTLDNGLDVIVHSDHRLPLVAVNVWYHVGSKNERPGRTGFAHLFEHLMFEGSEHHPHGYFGPLQRAGALINGSTNSDRTNYWEVVPTGALDLALWMESDRMGHLVPALTEAKLNNQRDVVLNERRQNYENRPYGRAGLALSTALFAETHPYHWPTIGWPDDLHAASLHDVVAFFQSYYHPANASLCIAGDVDPDDAMARAARYFGDIPRATTPPFEPPAPAGLSADRRMIMEDAVELPRLYVNWHSPDMHTDGDAELDLAADVLANGKTSRLYRTLVFDRRIATDVSAYQHSREAGGVFQVAATAKPGVPLADLDTAITDAIGELATGGPDEAEVLRGQTQTEAQFVYRLQTVGGFGGKSDQLNAYNVFQRDPGYFAADRARYDNATAAGIAASVERWLTGAPRAVLSVVPRGQRELALADSSDVNVP